VLCALFSESERESSKNRIILELIQLGNEKAKIKRRLDENEKVKHKPFFPKYSLSEFLATFLVYMNNLFNFNFQELKTSDERISILEKELKKSEISRKAAENLLESERRKTEIIQQVLGNNNNRQ